MFAQFPPVDGTITNFYGFLLFRLVCCLFSSTWFVPDETYQSVEVAYHMVYGRGHLTWEWHPDWALRSALHPLLYAVPFAALRFARLDFGWAIRWTPHLVQAILFALADLCYVRWLKRLGLAHKVFQLCLGLYLTNWFLLYCSTRTLSNTLECALTLIALGWYNSNSELHGKRKSTRKMRKSGQEEAEDDVPGTFYLTFVALAILLRPTAVLLWAPLGWHHFWAFSTRKGGKFDVHRAVDYFFRALPFPLAVLLLALAVDSAFYGTPTCCLWNFLKFNVFARGNALFGTHPWHWHFTQGLPPILGVSLLPLALILVKMPFQTGKEDGQTIPKRYGLTAALYLLGHSLIAHKEHRFLLPIVPLILPYAAQQAASWRSSTALNGFKLVLYTSNFVAILYLGLLHQRGPHAMNAKILAYLEGHNGNGNNGTVSGNGTVRILHLMPCFSLPAYAALHPHGPRVDIRMLDCGLGAQQIGQADAVDESDAFHANPADWLNRHWYEKRLFLYDLVVCYGHVNEQIEPFLMGKGFEREALLLHTVFSSSSRQHTRMVLLSRRVAGNG